MKGTVWGVGVGPGDPDLITVKARDLLARVPVLAWPAPLEGIGLARSIAEPHIPAGLIEIPIRLSFRPERDDTDRAYGEAASAIQAHVRQGRDVAVLCEGDPLFFGSFAHLLDHLAPDVPVRVIPGIASPMAAAARVVRPLTGLDDRLAVIPATAETEAIRILLAASDRAVIMKIGRHLPRVKALLAELGLDGVLVERVGQDGERIRPLAELDGDAPYFSLLLVHRP